MVGAIRSRPARLSTRLLILVMVAAVLAGCMAPAQDDTDGTGTNAPPRESGMAWRDHPELGKILTDAKGMTLYVFTNDDKGVSKCYGQCATNWPPYLADTVPTAPSEISGKLNLTKRTDNKTQVAYNGRPLYYWINDEKAGDATGDGVGAVWLVVREPAKNAQMLNGKGTFQTENRTVDYHEGTMGYYAKPVGQNASVGVVMIHEWWGLNANIKTMADILASNGYQVLAVDLFKGKVATTSQEAQAQIAAMNQQEATANMQGAADYLRLSGATKIVSLGWCFGGGQSLQLALSGEELVGTIIYYGQLVNDTTQLSKIKWPVLGIFGEADRSITPAHVKAFQTALNNASVENQVFIYPDVGHAFANPSGQAWAPDETKDAWTRTLDFLEDVK